jgi:prefoldin subunit 5
VAGCAQEAAPLLREDLDRARTDLAGALDRLAERQAQLRGDVQDGDRRTLEAVTEVQRGTARLGARLEELDRRLSRLQGQLDELNGAG